MSNSSLQELAKRLRQQSGLQSKRDIQAAARTFPHLPFPELGPAACIGDDAAVVPNQSGALLLACEGMHPELVQDDPWFAGWSGVLVNLSDIAAMGGRPVAVVNSLWSADAHHAAQLLDGMRFACDKFAIPMVGGHSNQQSPYHALSVAVLGTADGPVLSARAAQPGDELWLLVNQDGAFYRHYPFWDAATSAPGERLRCHLALLPQLARAGLVHAAKDVSMGGIVGTAVMFAEAADLSLELRLDAINRPADVGEEAWLTCFPSFGFLLAVNPQHATALESALSAHTELLRCPIGHFSAGPGEVLLSRYEKTELFWGRNEPLTGF